MSEQFDLIVETAIKRYQGSNFLVGDRVKFIENYRGHDWYKKQASLKLERLQDLIDSGDNIRISSVKALRPSTAQEGQFGDVDGFFVDIIREAAPGLFMSSQVFTIPQEMLELQEDYPNLAGDTPASQIRDDQTNIKPQEVEVNDNELSPVKQTATSDLDHKLLGQNADISTAAPAKSYTGTYMAG